MEMTYSHLLLADDDLDMCNQLSDYLRKNSFLVTAVNTAKQMLDLIAGEGIDLLLLEPRLHGEDGLRLTRTVRESSSMPIVVVTGGDEIADRVMGLSLAPTTTAQSLSHRASFLRVFEQCFADAKSTSLVRCATEPCAPIASQGGS